MYHEQLHSQILFFHQMAFWKLISDEDLGGNSSMFEATKVPHVHFWQGVGISTFLAFGNFGGPEMSSKQRKTLRGINISHRKGKGKSSTQNAIFGGYVSSLEGIFSTVAGFFSPNPFEKNMLEGEKLDQFFSQEWTFKTIWILQFDRRIAVAGTARNHHPVLDVLTKNHRNPGE